jgi:hypothetical protein
MHGHMNVKYIQGGPKVGIQYYIVYSIITVGSRYTVIILYNTV